MSGKKLGRNPFQSARPVETKAEEIPRPIVSEPPDDWVTTLIAEVYLFGLKAIVLVTR